MRIVMDYRPALRERSGVGEFVHQTARALTARYPEDSLTVFTSSWKDRPDARVSAAFPAAQVSDHRVPVRALNFAWHRLQWPPIELMTQRRYDIAFSPHPLLMPAHRAAQVVMVHDLDFLRHPQRTAREIRRDYPRLAGPHARRASRVIVPSHYTAADVVAHLGVQSNRVVVCPPAAPEWAGAVPDCVALDGYILFMGTLEPRKNVGALLDAYGRLIARRPAVPRLVLVGRAGPEAQPWLDALARPPLAGHVEYRGYVDDRDRQRIYCAARVLVLPSYDEGFGMPVLEAMSLGVPVIVARRGALPELAGDAGLLIDPDDPESLVVALDRLLTDDTLAETLGRRGFERSRSFRWAHTAEAMHLAFQGAIEEHRRVSNQAGATKTRAVT